MCVIHSVHREFLARGVWAGGVGVWPGIGVWPGVCLAREWVTGQGDVWSGGGRVSEGGRVAPPPEMATAAVSTHPTGMHRVVSEFTEFRENSNDLYF